MHGKFQYSKWLYIKFDKLNYFAGLPSVVDVVGSISTIKLAEVKLPDPTLLSDPPQNVSAVRDGKNYHLMGSGQHDPR
jgi:hypothetical protein